MRFVTFLSGVEPRLGLLGPNDTVVDLAKAAETGIEGAPGPLPADMVEFILAGEKALEMAQAIERAVRADAGLAGRLREQGALFDLTSVELLAPIPRPRKNVFCLGRNYAEHAAEGDRALGREVSLPQVPIFFTKPPTAVLAPEGAIELDERVTKALDFEAEMALVIGRRGKNIPASEAYDFIFGYTMINDVSARDLQRSHNQWFKGKSLDTSCPMGPAIVHKGEVANPQALDIRLRLNGTEMQRSNTRNMIFDIPTIIETLSRGMTLEPGDIIATGTPDGVGFARIPPVFLKDGDVVEVEVEGLGVLRNRVLAVRG